MSVPVQYRDQTRISNADLCSMAEKAFSETFAHLYEPEPFRKYLLETYGAGGSMDQDLLDRKIHWRAALVGEAPIGYAKVSALAAPAPSPKPNALELRQIYVLREWHGKGVADALMEWAIGLARSHDAPEIYLTVFDHNERAKRFYSRYAFSEVGHCTFTLGDRIDDDRIWCRPLS
jgi:GNAT superfamily N-acetyltransferase